MKRVFIPALLLVFMFWAGISSAGRASATYDEFEYISRGYLYLKTGDTRLKLRHPVLLDSLAAAPLLLLPDIQLPLDDPSLVAGDFHVYARRFFWETNAAQADQMLALARLPKILLMLLLAASVYRWGRERFGATAGFLAMALCVFDPNLLAHGRLATPDVGQTAFIFFAAFAWWRYLKQPGWRRLGLAGIALGLAQTAGFPALILYPILALAAAAYNWPAWRPRLWWRLAAWVAASGLSLLVIWLVYGFHWGVVTPPGIVLPAPYHWQEFIALIQRLGRQDLAFLNGEVYRGGRWDFFVVALLIKTPLPSLFLVTLGIVALLRRRSWRQDAALWLLPLLYYANALLSSLNIGYRHILPVLPFAFVLAGGTAVSLKRSLWGRTLLASMVGWLIIASLDTYPYYLTYFNETVGGPTDGRHHLVVSDLDWGQDLPGLQAYLQQQGVDEIFLSYFGTTPPEYYGIRYRPLPAWPPRGIAQQYPFHPDYPLPGIYALSAANLEGARFEQALDTFAWFWPRTPEAVIGRSIFIYRVPRLLDTAAAPVNVALSGLALADLPTAVFEERLRTNDLVLRWFDSRRTLVFPAGRTIMVLGSGMAVDEALAGRFWSDMPQPEQLASRGGDHMIRLYDMDPASQIAPTLQQQVANRIYVSAVPAPGFAGAQPLAAPVDVGTAASFLGYEWLTETIEPRGEIKLLSYWRVKERPAYPLAIFVHLLAPNGSILAQFDGLDVAADYWYPGDVIVQVHQFTAPDVLPAGADWLAVGLYRTDNFERLPLVINGMTYDRMLIDLAGS